MMDTSRFNVKRNKAKAIYKLRGILRGLVADKKLNNMELNFLALWLNEQKKLPEQGHVLDLIEMISDILSDGKVSNNELNELRSQVNCVVRFGTSEPLKNEDCINELLGLIDGIACDDKVQLSEFTFLDDWLQKHNQIVNSWPANIIAKRIEEIKEDGVVSEEEREHFLETLKKITGTRFSEDGSADGNASEVWMDHIDDFTHENTAICFTGKFLSGTRGACEDLARLQGAIIKKAVSGAIDVLVVGSTASKDWRFTSHGRKIERAMELKKEGHNIIILSENAWVECCS